MADAGMVSEANRETIEDARLSYIIDARIPQEPYQVKKWRHGHPGQEIARRAGLHRPVAGNLGEESCWSRDKVTYYRYQADSARRTLRGINQQVAKAERAVAGKQPVKRNRFVKLTGGDKSVNRDLEAKARAVAGLKAYITNLENPTPEFVIGAYHHKRDSIEAHLNAVFAALALTRLIEDRTRWSIKKFVRTTRRYRTVQIRAGNQILTAGNPLPRDLRDALALIN